MKLPTTPAEAKNAAKNLGFEYNPHDAELFKDVFYIVRATHFEQHMLWFRDHYAAPYLPKYMGLGYAVQWEEVSRGYHLTIGHLADMPVHIAVNYAIIGGHRVMFYEDTSQVVDHRMIDAWLHHWAPKIPQTDGFNFGHCLQACGVIRKEGR